MSTADAGESDREILVLTSRPDLDLAISLWLPGYWARRVDHVGAAVAAAGPDTVVLVEQDTLASAGGPPALRERGIYGPVIVLGSDEVVIDLVEDAVVHAPFGLEGVRGALELAVPQDDPAADGADRRRRAEAIGGRRRSWWSARSASRGV